MTFYDYHECELRDCLLENLVALGYIKQAEMVREAPFTIELINQLIETIKLESFKKNKPLDERLYFLGLTYE